MTNTEMREALEKLKDDLRSIQRRYHASVKGLAKQTADRLEALLAAPEEPTCDVTFQPCNAEMSRVAGGGFIYCNSMKGHDGPHTHTYPSVITPIPAAAPPVPQEALREAVVKALKVLFCPTHDRSALTSKFCPACTFCDALTELAALATQPAASTPAERAK